jgi:hypothetical protein
VLVPRDDRQNWGQGMKHWWMAALMAVVMSAPGAALADGALAVGMPANIVKDGFFLRL